MVGSFAAKSEYTSDDIQSLIDHHYEESVHLEFKGPGALDKTEKKRDEISKDVASFANSDGGVIVYGVDEDKSHRATKLSFINGKEFTKEWLEQVIQSNVKRPIDGLRVFPIRFDDNANQTIYVVKIPASLDAPHMSRDGKYYRRDNFRSVPMEEYEVRNSYGRRKRSELKIVETGISELSPTVEFKDGVPLIPFRFLATVANVGDVTVRDFNLNLYFEPAFSFTMESVTPKQGVTTTFFDKDEVSESKCKISCPSHAPLYSEESRTAAELVVKLPIDFVRTKLSDVRYEYRLFYDGEHDVASGRIDKEWVEGILANADEFLRGLYGDGI